MDLETLSVQTSDDGGSDGNGSSGGGRDGDGREGIKRERKIHSFPVLNKLLVYQGAEAMPRKH